MTFWYAPASAEAEVHFSPSLLPDQPPNDGMTSPPAARMLLIAVWSEPPVSARSPSHFGLQPPSDRMKASVNHLLPAAFITSAGFCGLPQPRYSYGAAPMLAGSAWACWVDAWVEAWAARAAPTTSVPAATVAAAA